MLEPHTHNQTCVYIHLPDKKGKQRHLLPFCLVCEPPPARFHTRAALRIESRPKNQAMVKARQQPGNGKRRMLTRQMRITLRGRELRSDGRSLFFRRLRHLFKLRGSWWRLVASGGVWWWSVLTPGTCGCYYQHSTTGTKTRTTCLKHPCSYSWYWGTSKSGSRLTIQNAVNSPL